MKNESDYCAYHEVHGRVAHLLIRDEGHGFGESLPQAVIGFIPQGADPFNGGRAKGKEEEMDPVTKGILADLRAMHRAKEISFAEYLEGVQAMRQQSANMSTSNVVQDESVSESLSTVKGDEKEFPSDVGERATTGKSQHVQAEVHAEYQMGVEGDLAHLLYDLNLCLPCELGDEGVKQGTQKFQEAESCFFHSDSGTVHPKANASDL